MFASFDKNFSSSEEIETDCHYDEYVILKYLTARLVERVLSEKSIILIVLIGWFFKGLKVRQNLPRGRQIKL